MTAETSMDELVLRLIQAPYTGFTAYIVTEACTRLRHPPRRPEQPDSPCPCCSERVARGGDCPHVGNR